MPSNKAPEHLATPRRVMAALAAGAATGAVLQAALFLFGRFQQFGLDDVERYGFRLGGLVTRKFDLLTFFE